MNDAAVADEKATLTPKDVVAGVIKLSLGKKRHVLLKPDKPPASGQYYPGLATMHVQRRLCKPVNRG